MDCLAGNPGAWPVDPSTPVGNFRHLVGDVDAEDFSPPEVGIKNFELFSDADIEAYLEKADGSMSRAVGLSYLYLAGQAAKASRSIKDYDLQIDTTKRAADLREIAKWWFDLADNDDIADSEDAFEIVPTGTRGGEFIPELTLPVWGRQYTLGRWR